MERLTIDTTAARGILHAVKQLNSEYGCSINAMRLKESVGSQEK